MHSRTAYENSAEELTHVDDSLPLLGSSRRQHPGTDVLVTSDELGPARTTNMSPCLVPIDTSLKSTIAASLLTFATLPRTRDF